MKPLHQTHRSGFTLLELLTVMAIIITLAGIILAGVGYAQQKAARERAVAEIAALGVALESYKADNGDYPAFASGTGPTPATLTATPANTGALLLFTELRAKQEGGVWKTGYYEFKNDMVDTNNAATTTSAVIDPFGNPYGYSRGGVKNPATMYDLWSTGGSAEEVKWITNW